MNFFTDVLFLFVYILIMLSLKMPDVINTDYIIHKLQIFIEIFMFYYVVKLMSRVYNDCKILPWTIMQQSFTMGLYCVIGYSIYVDLLHMDKTCSLFGDITQVDPMKRHVIISFIMILFVIIVQAISVIFGSSNNKCFN
jgi:hypothetical protein